MTNQISRDQFIEFAEENLTIAKGLLQRDGALDPILFIFNSDWQLQIVQMITETVDVPMHMIVRAAVTKFEARAFLFLGETWISEVTFSPGENIPESRIRPSDDPNHYEGIVCAGAHPDYRISWITKFIRNDDGTLVFEKTIRMEERGSGFRDYGVFTRIPLAGMIDDIQQN